MRNNNQWTESRFHSFVKGGLRSISNRWPPKFAVKKASWLKRGFYMCAGYGIAPHEVPASFINEKGKRENNIFCDHISPVVDTEEGFTSWDNLIERLFCEADGLQILCKVCHDLKSKDERDRRTVAKRNK